MANRPLSTLGIGLCIPAIVLSGCSGSSSYAAPPWSHDGSTVVNERRQRDASRVMLTHDCPVTDEKLPMPPTPFAFPLLGLAVGVGAPVAINLAFSSAKKYVEQAKKDLTYNYTASGASPLIENGALKYKCLVVARGSFGAQSPEISKYPAVASLNLKENKKLQALGLSRYPALYFEAKLELETVTVKIKKDGGTEETRTGHNLVITPGMLHFASTAARRTDDNMKSIGMIFAISKAALDPQAGAAGATDKSLSIIPLIFPNIPIGTEYRERTSDTGTDNPLADQKRSVLFGEAGGALPAGTLNFSSFVTETEDASAFYDLMLSALSSKQTEAGLDEFIAGVKKLGQQ